MDLLRKGLAVVILLIAVVGLLPLVPLAFGFKSATITNNSAGTFYPTTNPASADTRFIFCDQSPSPLQLVKATTNSGNYFRCTNNWGTAVTITWSRISGTNTTAVTGGTTIAANAQGVCVPANITTVGGANTTNIPNVYQGIVDQADLYAVIQFSGNVSTRNTAGTACL